MLAAWILSATMLSSPGVAEPGPPPPILEPQAPIEGPAPPPVVEPEPASEPEPPVEPGIEFAVDPPEAGDEGEPEPESVGPSAPGEQPSWPDPGTAPSNGMGMLVAGVIFVPSAALFTLALLRGARGTEHTTPILVTGIGMELIALGLIGTGIYRQAKLRRWTVAYRVVARPQGAGMLSAGGIALSFGGSLVASGIVLMTGDASRTGTGAALIGVGVAGLAAIAPPLIYFGKRRRDRYLASGGWYRRPLPTVELVPRVLVGRDSLGLGVGGRF